MKETTHRGFGDQYPENTVCAGHRVSQFADATEIDVHRCGSGVLVVSHWNEVEHVTDVVESAHEAGMEVHAWPVRSRTLAWTLVRQRVDSLTATKPL